MLPVLPSSRGPSRSPVRRPRRRSLHRTAREYRSTHRNGNLLIGRSHRLELVKPNGRLVKRLTHPSARQTDFDASFSPDGKKVAFIRARDAANIDHGANRMTVDIRSGRTRVIHRPLRLPGYDEWASWSPDGRHIAFRTQYEAPGSGGLRRSVIAVVRPNGRGLTEYGLAEPRDAEVFPSRMLDWSPNGRCLAWSTLMPQSDQDGIILVDAQARAPRPAGPFYGRGYQGGWPTFATFAGNGGSLLVTDLKDVPGNHYVIRALSLRRHAQRVLVADAGGGVAPVSSPDGRSLVYQDQRGRILVRRVSGGRARVLIRDGYLEDWASR